MGLLTLDDVKLIVHRYYNCRVIVDENLELTGDPYPVISVSQRLCNPRCYDENGWRN